MIPESDADSANEPGRATSVPEPLPPIDDAAAVRNMSSLFFFILFFFHKKEKWKFNRFCCV